MGLCSETKIRDEKVNETLVVEVNKFGQVLSVKALSVPEAASAGDIKPVEMLERIAKEHKALDLKDVVYAEDEEWFEKTLRGANFYSAGTCCWKLVRGKWKCREEYC